MITRQRVLTAALVAALVTPAIGAAQVSRSDINGPANLIQVDNQVDQTVKTQANIQVARASAEDTEAGNLAYATAHDCTGCQALAAAYQVVFISPDNTNFSPQNVGLAVNSNCHSCGSFAYAYQYAVTVEHGVHLSGHDRRQITDLEDQASTDLRSGQPYATIDADLHDIAKQFRAIVDGAIQRASVKVDDRQVTEKHKNDEADSPPPSG